jgi:hypothetical protein
MKRKWGVEDRLPQLPVEPSVFLGLARAYHPGYRQDIVEHLRSLLGGLLLGLLYL